MNGRVIGTLIAKDLTLFFKNRFFAFITVLGLVFYIAVYFLMPNTVDERLDLAIYAADLPPLIGDQLAEGSFEVAMFASEEALRQSIEDGDQSVGIALPDGLLSGKPAGSKPVANIYFGSDVPDEFQELYEIFVEELAYLLGGQPLNLETNEEILGPDLAGQQIPPRDRMLPLLAVFVLMLEMLGLATLISTEIETGTLRALLVTPMRVSDLFVAKGTTGVVLGFTQSILILAITGGLTNRPVLMLVTLFLGALMITGLAFLVASVAKDMMSVLGWGVLAMLTLAIPAFTVLLPDLASDWMQIIPSFYLVDTMHRVLNFGAGWGDVTGNLVAMVVASAGLLLLGGFVLRRKFS